MKQDNQSFYIYTLLFIGKHDRCFLLQLYVYQDRGRALNLRYFILLVSHTHEKRKRAGRKKNI